MKVRYVLFLRSFFYERRLRTSSVCRWSTQDRNQSVLGFGRHRDHETFFQPRKKCMMGWSVVQPLLNLCWFSIFSPVVICPYVSCKLSRMVRGQSSAQYTLAPISCPDVLYPSGTASLSALMIAVLMLIWLAYVDLTPSHFASSSRCCILFMLLLVRGRTLPGSSWSFQGSLPVNL